MKAGEMRAWRKKMGVSQAVAAKMLGYAERRAIVRWETNEKQIPKCVALACAAIEAGLPPFGSAA